MLGLRLASAASLSIGALALYSINPTPTYLLALAVCLFGCWFSHVLEGRSLRRVKVLLALGMLYLLSHLLASLMASLQDTRLPLAELLLWLQALNAYDLPRRHNLRIAQMVACILMVVTATLSRDTAFGLFVLAFAASAIWWGLQDMASELGGGLSLRVGPGRRMLLGSFGVLMMLGGVLFFVVPRSEGGVVTQLPMSSMLTLPPQFSPRIVNPAYPVGTSGSGAHLKVNPEAYFGFSEQLDLNYRGHLSEAIALKVRSPRRQYWRGMAYDRYDGRTWHMLMSTRIATISTSQLPFNLPGDPNGRDSGRTGVVTFYVEKDQSNLVLMPERPDFLYFPSNLLFQDMNEAIRSPVPLSANLYYSVVMDLAGYHRSWLRQAPRLTKAWIQRLAPYLQLPSSVSARTRSLARRVAGDAPNELEALRRLETHLARHYRYNLDIAEFPPGADTVDYFLFRQPRHEGYCEHFATTLAILARTLGIPTRLVTGYLPGSYNPFTGFYEVKTSEAHAWVEAYFLGVGWVPFDPTPGGSDPMEVSSQGAPLPIRDLVFPIGKGGTAIAWLALVGLLGGLALFVRRAWALRQPEAAAARAYRRVLRLLERHGLVLVPGATPGEYLERVRSHAELQAVASELAHFVAAYEAERFGDRAQNPELDLQVEAIARRLRMRKKHHRAIGV